MMSTGQHVLQTARDLCRVPGILSGPPVEAVWRHTLADNTLLADGYAATDSVTRHRTAVDLCFC
jgi:hypothetical protein